MNLRNLALLLPVALVYPKVSCFSCFVFYWREVANKTRLLRSLCCAVFLVSPKDPNEVAVKKLDYIDAELVIVQNELDQI